MWRYRGGVLKDGIGTGLSGGGCSVSEDARRVG